MSMLYEACPFCATPSASPEPRHGDLEPAELEPCRHCRGTRFMPIGVTRDELEALVKCEPTRAQAMRAALRRIEESPVLWEESRSIVQLARATLDQVGR